MSPRDEPGLPCELTARSVCWRPDCNDCLSSWSASTTLHTLPRTTPRHSRRRDAAPRRRPPPRNGPLAVGTWPPPSRCCARVSSCRTVPTGRWSGAWARGRRSNWRWPCRAQAQATMRRAASRRLQTPPARLPRLARLAWLPLLRRAGSTRATRASMRQTRVGRVGAGAGAAEGAGGREEAGEASLRGHWRRPPRRQRRRRTRRELRPRPRLPRRRRRRPCAMQRWWV